MNERDDTPIIIVGGQNDALAASVEELVPAGAAVRWCAPRDVDEVDRAAREKSASRVIFTQTDVLLGGLWSGTLAVDEWPAGAVRVEVLHPAGAVPAAFVADLVADWGRHRRAQRRRQAVAGVILSAVALAAAFVLNAVA
ncbi:MAG: hypothetical protein PVJ57_03830 [Phycisphaerae bacterium]|jgi:hypothetical protein